MNGISVTSKPRGLLMDWGGVMTSNVFESFASFCQQEGIELEAVAQLFRGDEQARQLLFDFECGKIGEPEFEPGLAEILGITEHHGLVARMFDGARAQSVMLDAIKAVRGSGIRTGMLSNSWGEHTYPHELFDELFDILVISGHEGVRKPDLKIYEIARDRIGLPFDQLVFVDDLTHNLKPARQVGMTTIHHTDPASTILQLNALFDIGGSET